MVPQWASEEEGEIDVDSNDSSRGRGWRWLDDGRKGELSPGQRAWRVMSKGLF